MLFERWGATESEVAESLPGDDLITPGDDLVRPGDDLIQPEVRERESAGSGLMSATRSISLASSPDDVFPWLTQMGFGRAGWYSYDWIDNLARRSATTIVDHWQVADADDRVPAGPIDFTVAEIESPRHLVLALLDQPVAGHRIDFTLAYCLRPLGNQGQGAVASTRLVSRARARVTGPLARGLVAGLTLGDGIMVRRQLLGLAQRCGRA